MGIERINRRSSIIGGTGLGGRQQSPVVARGPMFAGYDIPPQEVAELYKLYTQTGGPSWINHTNWFANKQCATWFGLTVAGGRVTEIRLSDNNLSGLTSFTIKPFTALTHFYVKKNTSNENLEMHISANDLADTMQKLYSFGTKSFFDAQIADLPAGMREVSCYPSSSRILGTVAEIPSGMTLLGTGSQSKIVGSLSDLKAGMQYFVCTLSLSEIDGGSVPMSAIGIAQILLAATPHTQASKDSIIERIYADRALFTYAGHTLNISGGAALTGVYQTSAAPSTPAEKAYALVNDPNGEGFLKWAITL